jgi:hypothetical protein
VFADTLPVPRAMIILSVIIRDLLTAYNLLRFFHSTRPQERLRLARL